MRRSRRMKKGPKPERRRDAGRPRGPAIVEAVLAETIEELVQHGIANVSVERIARAADVNKTSVYRRWPTRAELVAAALERVRHDLGFELRDTGSLRGDLLVLGKSIASLIESPVGRELARAAFTESSSMEPPALAAASEPANALVRRARDRGELSATVDPQMILGLLAGAILHRTMLEHAPATGDWLEKLLDILVGGLRGEPAAPRARASKRSRPPSR